MTVDMNEVMLTDEHRRAIAETLVGRDVELERVYRQLECVLKSYQIFEQDRKLNQLKQFKTELKRWQRQRELLSELIIIARAHLEEAITWSKIFHEYPTAKHYEEKELARSRSLHKMETRLATFEEMQQEADSQIKILNGLVRAFRQNRNPFRKTLYENVLLIWQDTIKGKLTYSRPGSGGEPYGPLIDFFCACLGPVLGGKMPGPYGIAAIIDGVRDSGFRSGHLPPDTTFKTQIRTSKLALESR
jgi:hypothetical protein